MTADDPRAAVREWILERNPEVPAADLTDHTPLIERRYLTSLQVADLLVLIEQLRGAPVDPNRLKPGVFRSIDAIHDAFFT